VESAILKVNIKIYKKTLTDAVAKITRFQDIFFSFVPEESDKLDHHTGVTQVRVLNSTVVLLN